MCLCVQFDFSLFDHSSVRVLPVTSRVGEGKFPYIHPTYRADGNPDLYVGKAWATYRVLVGRGDGTNLDTLVFSVECKKQLKFIVSHL